MALALFGDFGFAAGSDETANPYQDAQRCINWYPEISPSQGAKMPVSLLGCPGLTQLVAAPGGGAPGFSASMTVWPPASGVTDLPVRGAWVLPGYQSALVVIADTCYLATVTAQGSSTTPGALTLASVGTLATSAGPVCIRDSGAIGGYAVLVDGDNGYLYNYGASAGSFTGAIVLGTPTVTLAAQVPLGLIIGQTLSAVTGIPSGTTLLAIDYSGGTLTMSANATATNDAQTIDYTVPTPWVQITDPGFLGADTVAFIDGWWIFNEPGTQTFFTNSQPYAVNFNPTYFAQKDAASDLLVAVIENKEELWLIGERTTEIWYDAGGAFFPFQRLVGTPIQEGSKAGASVCQLSANGTDSLIWFGRNVQGENVVVLTNGFSCSVVSTPAVSDQIATYPVTSDAQGYVYQEDTHVFYVLTFPTADRTWVYDASLPAQFAWHERLSYDPYAAAWHRHRSNCFMNFAGMRIVGDYQNGALYQLTRSAYTDAGWPLRAVRRSPYVWNAQDRERVFFSQLQLDFRLGQGNASGMGTNPQTYLRISRDYGATYGPSTSSPLGAQGQFTNRCIFRRLGFSRGAVLEAEVIDPVNRDLIGVTLRAAGP